MAQILRASEAGEHATDPAAYARDVLHAQWWSRQEEIARLLLKPPYKVLVKACHKVGKTHLAGGLVNWWFDSFPKGVVLTTAPTDRQVRDLLWKEVRVQRRGRRGFRGPKMPRLETSPDHFAHGFTARDGDAFQGTHSPHTLIVFDEAVGVDRTFWETAKSMFAGEGHAWLAIFNPTDTSSQAYIEEATGNWHVVTLSALEHPNIAAELRGEPPLVPAAIRLAWLDERLKEWCTPVVGEPQPGFDVEWPPGSGRWLRPGPVAEARLLGRWPSQGTYSVWSDALWQATRASLPESKTGAPEIGCDVARFGDDWTCIHARWGSVSLHHEASNGRSTSETAGRLKQLAREMADYANARRDPSAEKVRPQDIRVKVDDDGVGGGGTDQADGYSFVPVSGASRATHTDDYPNRRSELWFATAERARMGKLSLARLPVDALQRLRQQAMAPTWKLDAAGRRVVEPKETTKRKLGRSPDDLDALALAYFECPEFVAPKPVEQKAAPRSHERSSSAERRGLWGR